MPPEVRSAREVHRAQLALDCAMASVVEAHGARNLSALSTCGIELVSRARELEIAEHNARALSELDDEIECRTVWCRAHGCVAVCACLGRPRRDGYHGFTSGDWANMRLAYVEDDTEFRDCPHCGSSVARLVP